MYPLQMSLETMEWASHIVVILIIMIIIIFIFITYTTLMQVLLFIYTVSQKETAPYFIWA